MTLEFMKCWNVFTESFLSQHLTAYSRYWETLNLGVATCITSLFNTTNNIIEFFYFISLQSFLLLFCITSSPCVLQKHDSCIAVFVHVPSTFCSHLVQKTFQHTRSLNRQWPGNPYRLLQNYWKREGEKERQKIKEYESFLQSMPVVLWGSVRERQALTHTHKISRSYTHTLQTPE